jgi:hypothetical protein
MRNRQYYRLVRKAAVAEADLTRKLIAWFRRREASYRQLLRPRGERPKEDTASSPRMTASDSPGAWERRLSASSFSEIVCQYLT